jgi:hypothetical protein
VEGRRVEEGEGGGIGVREGEAGGFRFVYSRLGCVQGVEEGAMAMRGGCRGGGGRDAGCDDGRVRVWRAGLDEE